MKKWRKAILAMLCVGVIFATTACATRNNGTNDNAANNTNTEQKDRNNNDVTDGTDKNKNNNGGVIDDVGDATGNVINDIGNGVENITDDTLYAGVEENNAPTVADPANPYANIAITNVKEYLSIRAAADKNAEALGKLYPKCAATVLETLDGWYKVTSGSVTGKFSSGTVFKATESGTNVTSFTEMLKSFLAQTQPTKNLP